MWLAGRLVAVIRRGAIRIRQQWRTLYAWSNFCAPAPAASAKPFATNWRSVFSVRITFTERLSTHGHPTACRAGRRADRLPRLRAVRWILPWERIPAALPAFRRAIAESGASDLRTAVCRLLVSI